MPCPGGLSSYDCFVLRDQNIKSGSYTRLKHLLLCVFCLKRLIEVAIGTFYRDQNCESAIGSVPVDFLRPKFRVVHTKDDVIIILMHRYTYTKMYIIKKIISCRFILC